MKLSHLLLTTSLCAVAAAPLLAQSRSFSSIDANGDRQLSFEELEAAFGRRGANSIMSRSDLDGNGLVSASEVQVSQDDERDDESDDDESDEDDESSDDESDEGDEGDEGDDEGDESDEGDDEGSDEGDDGGDEGDDGGDEGGDEGDD